VGKAKSCTTPDQQSRSVRHINVSEPFDQMLTNFASRPLEVTPLENMDPPGYFHAPKEGIAKALPVIVMNTTPGWYDTPRFASPSGQAEIVSNEGFYQTCISFIGRATHERIPGIRKGPSGRHSGGG
jgi:hypothetical protein